MDISIVILNYKSKGDTLHCIKSIKEADWINLKYEIIVVDNDSGDSVGEVINWQYPDVIFIQNKENTGMGAGNNIGLKRAEGRYSVVMNPDTIAFKDTFQILYKYMEANPGVGMVGPQQIYPNQSVQNSCFHWPGLLTPLYRRTFLGRLPMAKKDLRHYLMSDFKHNVEKEVDWLLGSFLFIRREALEKIDYFDERYFMYLEDTDLCKRFWENKWKVVYFPQAKIIHNHARESANVVWYKSFTSPTARYHIVSWFKYLKKWKNF